MLPKKPTWKNPDFFNVPALDVCLSSHPSSAVEGYVMYEINLIWCAYPLGIYSANPEYESSDVSFNLT